MRRSKWNWALGPALLAGMIIGLAGVMLTVGGGVVPTQAAEGDGLPRVLKFRGLIQESRVVCRVYRQGNKQVTEFCRDGYECDLVENKCRPGPEIRRQIEEAKARREAEFKAQQKQLADLQRSLRKQARYYSDLARAPAGTGNDLRRVPSAQPALRSGGSCSTITGLGGSSGGSTCTSSRGNWVTQVPPKQAGTAYRVPQPSPRPDPRLQWRQQQAQWTDYLARIGGAIASTPPGTPARQQLEQHRREARTAFQEQNRTYVVEELPHDPTASVYGPVGSGVGGGGPGASGSEPGGAVAGSGQGGATQSGTAGLGNSSAGRSAAGNQVTANGAAGGSAVGGAASSSPASKALAEEEVCARVREHAERGSIALFSAADVPSRCAAQINQIRAEVAARAGLDPKPLYVNAEDREIIRGIQRDYRDQRPDAGPPDTRPNT